MLALLLAASLDILHYRAALTLKAQEIGAEVEVTFKAVENTTTLDLQLDGLTVDAVEHEGRTAAFTRDGSSLRVALNRPVPPYERSSVIVRYHGTPSDGLSMKANKHGAPTVFADNWPDRAHGWLVSRDHPSDKATVDFIVTAPETMQVVANGELLRVESAGAGQRRWHWHEAVPIPVHCMVIGAATFDVIRAGASGGTDVSYYLFPEDAEKGREQIGRAVSMVDYFTTTVGPFPYEKLAIVQSATRYGGMENASAIFMPEAPFGKETSLERTVAHEIAHQWFGDSITQERWGDLWLSEGFATYFAALWIRHERGQDAFAAEMRRQETAYLESYSKIPKGETRPFQSGEGKPVFDATPAKLTGLLNANSYQKGSWVLHMLRRLIGDEAFFRGIRDYYAAYRDRNASTSDLQQVMEHASGRDLEPFFRRWIFSGGHPVLRTRWSWDAAAKKVTVTVEQTQAGAAFEMPLDVDVDGRRETIVLTGRTTNATFDADKSPETVVFDPENWLLDEQAGAR